MQPSHSWNSEKISWFVWLWMCTFFMGINQNKLPNFLSSRLLWYNKKKLLMIYDYPYCMHRIYYFSKHTWSPYPCWSACKLAQFYITSNLKFKLLIIWTTYLAITHRSSLNLTLSFLCKNKVQQYCRFFADLAVSDIMTFEPVCSWGPESWTGLLRVSLLTI